MLDVLEAGADDLKANEQSFEVYTSPEASRRSAPPLKIRITSSFPRSLKWFLGLHQRLRRDDVKNLQKMLEMFEVTPISRTCGTLGRRLINLNKYK
jgi:transcriptional/translational regulatory protein YebC/TACO1